MRDLRGRYHHRTRVSSMLWSYYSVVLTVSSWDKKKLDRRKWSCLDTQM